MRCFVGPRESSERGIDVDVYGVIVGGNPRPSGTGRVLEAAKWNAAEWNVVTILSESFPLTYVPDPVLRLL